MKTPLDQITVKCCDCGCTDTASDINEDKVRYYNASGRIVRFPKDGVTEEQKIELSRMALRCECCQEDEEDR